MYVTNKKKYLINIQQNAALLFVVNKDAAQQNCIN